MRKSIVKRWGIMFTAATLLLKSGIVPLMETQERVWAKENTQSRYVEALDRGLTAVKVGDGVYLSWRYLGTDTENTVFQIYRDGIKISGDIATSTNYKDVQGVLGSIYTVHTLVNGVETGISEEVSVQREQYFDIPLDKPAPGVTPTGAEYSYTANDASCADLDGDGEYEIIMQWMPTNAGDVNPDGYRGNIYIDAYKMDGTKLWRIDRGVNIRAGQHYAPFMVYDFDSDGYGELVIKTADGTVDGLGNVIGDADADWRNGGGAILDGPEYLTLFDGYTGEALDTIDYEPTLKSVAEDWAGYWGDGYGNRSERYAGAVAYLDGKRPSVVMCRGIYKNFQLVAYNIVNKKFVKLWNFNTADEGNEKCISQGNHNLAVADCDGDGFDEIVYGACTIDHDGTALYSSDLGHGDALHVGDFDPDRDGIEIWSCFEATGGGALRAAESGEILVRDGAGPWDTGRAIAGNFIPDELTEEQKSWGWAENRGAEFTHSGSYRMLNSAGNVVLDGNGEEVGWITKWNMNSAIYWTGTLEREVLDRTFVDGYNIGRVYSAPGAIYNNGTKANASLTADLFGDWREEMIFPAENHEVLRVYTTVIPTEYRIATLMHDTQYRCQVASQNVGYNQPPHTSFYLGTGSPLPEQPDVEEVEAPEIKDKIAAYDFETVDGTTITDATGNGNDMILHGAASVREDASVDSATLYLDGTTGTYAEFPKGMFDGLDALTVEMDIKAGNNEDDYMTFSVGKNQDKYMVLKVLNQAIYSAITTSSYPNEEKIQKNTESSVTDKWIHIALVMENNTLKLYKDRELFESIDTDISMSDLGENLLGYLGKSFYAADNYFKGSFDHVEIYNYAKTANNLAKKETVTFTCEAVEGGHIEGKTTQTIKKDTTTAAVTAVADAGWHFVCWSDGVDTADRQEFNLTEDKSVRAIFGKDRTDEKGLIAAYDFENRYGKFIEDTTGYGNVLELHNNATEEENYIMGNNVLYLDGSADTYAEFPQGMFDGMNTFTILMDVNSQMAANTNMFTFGLGQDNQKYVICKLDDTTLKAAITKESWNHEDRAIATLENSRNDWVNLAFVWTDTSLKVYKDKKLVAENNALKVKVSDLGENLLAYLGKSFFSADAYFRGYYDNVKVFNYAMTEEELDEAVTIDKVTVKYLTDGNGSINGEEEQTIKKGTKTAYVEAVGNEGYTFTSWSDGLRTAERREELVAEDMEVTALFAKERVDADTCIAAYDFEDSLGNFAKDTSGCGNVLELFGNAVIKEDVETGSKVLVLDGTDSTYAAMPEGLFDGMDAWTLRMKVRPETVEGNYFTFGVGQNTDKYLIFRTHDEQLKTAITTTTYSGEQKVIAPIASCAGQWMDMTITVEDTSIRMYMNNRLVAEKNDITISTGDLGENLQAWFGKSFYGADIYFAGAFDDIKVYNYAMTAEELLGDIQIFKPELADETEFTFYSGPEDCREKYIADGKIVINGGNGHKAISNIQAFTDFVYEAKINITAQTNQNSAQGGLLFRASNGQDGTDGCNGYYFGLDVATQQVLLGKMSTSSVEPVWTQLAAEPAELSLNTEYRVVITVKGEEILCEVYDSADKVAEINITDNSKSAGGIGVRTWYADATFTELKVSPYEDNEPGTGTDTPGTGTDTPGTGTDTPGTGTDTPGTGTDTPGTGTDTPGTGATTPEQVVLPDGSVTVESSISAITSNKTENDAKDSTFAELSLRVVKSTKNYNKIKWNKVKKAEGYIIFASRCGKPLEIVQTVTNGKTTSWTHKKLQKGKYYKYTILAYKLINGKQVTISTSRTIHVPTAGGKVTDIKAIKVNKSKVSLKKGKTFKLKATEVKKDSKKKISRHKKISYESSNTSIATVSKSGKIKAKGKGSCTIYVYAQNGVFKKVKVTVK